MAFVEPVTLTGRGIRLEPLERAHHDALEEAAADGELWRIRVSSVPEPGGMAGYIEQALASRAAGDRFPFAVIEEATGRVLGSTSFHDIAPAVRRVEIGYTWYAKSVQRTHVNTAAKRLCSATPSRPSGAGWSAGAPTTSTSPASARSSGSARRRTA